MKQSFKEINFELTKNLIMSSVFYVPPILIERMDRKHKRFLKLFEGKLLYLDHDDGPVLVKENPISYKVQGKRVYLDDNMLFLFDLMEGMELEGSKAKFILERYSNLLLSFLKLFKLIEVHYREHLGNLSTDHELAIRFQVEIVDGHYLEFRNKFFKDEPTNDIIIPKLEEKDVEQIKEALEEQPFNSKLEEMEMEEEPKLDRKTKLKAIRDKAKKDAEFYVLKNVFNIELSQE